MYLIEKAKRPAPTDLGREVDNNQYEAMKFTLY